MQRYFDRFLIRKHLLFILLFCPTLALGATLITHIFSYYK